MPTEKRQKKQRLPKDASIAIVGGGLGGLGAALSLEQQGFTNVTVYERDASPSDAMEGYGLTLTYNPKGPLAKMGILEQVAQQDCPSRSHYIFAPDGSILGYYGNAFAEQRGMGQRGNLRVPRQVLRRILLENTNSKIQWGKRLERFDRTPQQSDNETDNDNDNTYQMYFEDGSVVRNVDLLVGADGIRSRVVRTLLAHTNHSTKPDHSTKDNETAGLRYLGVMIILGIANICHPLLDERGFYTLDGENRLFTMPYEGSKLDDEQGEKNYQRGSADCSSSKDEATSSAKTRVSRRIMWQLSYRLDDESEAKRLRAAGAEALQDEVIRRCQSWHDPVLDMVQSTPLDTIWGTGLMNRDPEELLGNMDPKLSSRVVILGDAAHSMSPFKGQGANQSLSDGPLLASWLQRSTTESAVRGFLREMTARTAIKVKASKEAAAFLHSPRVLLQQQDFASVKTDAVPHFLEYLRERGIGADAGLMLDDSVGVAMKELDLSDDMTQNNRQPNSKSVQASESKEQRALLFSAMGDIVGLRDMSLLHSAAIRSARDKSNRSCLHLAALGGHYQCCRWLLTEAFVAHDPEDDDNITPFRAALKNGNERVIALLSETSVGKELA